MASISLSRGPSIDIEKCVTNVGNRYDMVLIAAARTRERRRRFGPVHRKDALIMSLKDIEAGSVGREYLKKI
jgi:DNA-directed RNA polymerase omega subunit